MHQQVRCLITQQSDGTRGKLEEASLVEILKLLSGTNLRSAGRVHSDGGEEFVFSVQHDKDDDDIPDQKARDILKKAHYEAELYAVEHVILDHHEGALLRAIEELEADRGEPVIEVYVAAAERNGKIPVQLVTRSMLNR